MRLIMHNDDKEAIYLKYFLEGFVFRLTARIEASKRIAQFDSKPTSAYRNLRPSLNVFIMNEKLKK